MFKHYCDICGKELCGKAKTISISDMEVPQYNTDVLSTPSVSCETSYSGTISCNPHKLYSRYEICIDCADEIEKRCRHD